MSTLLCLIGIALAALALPDSWEEERSRASTDEAMAKAMYKAAQLCGRSGQHNGACLLLRESIRLQQLPDEEVEAVLKETASLITCVARW